jgi:putative addiction module killer protein
MLKWIIEYWAKDNGTSPIEDWLDNLTKEQLRSVAKELELLELFGNKLRLPHSRPLGDGLFELRERRYNYRIYYGFYGVKIIILLEAGEKKKQESNIKTARERLIELTKFGIKK